MNAHAPPLPPSPAERAQAVLGEQLAMLKELAEIGMTIARAVGRQVEAATAGDGAAEPEALKAASVTFNRAARAVRLSLALQSQLIKAAPAPPADDTDDDEEDDGLPGIFQMYWTLPDWKQIERVQGVVRRVAEAEARDGAEVESLVEEAGVRLKDEGRYGEIAEQPLGQVLAAICRDLGLSPDWAKLSEDAWAQEEIRRRPKGSPYITWRRDRAAEAAAAAAGRGEPWPPPVDGSG